MLRDNYHRIDLFKRFGDIYQDIVPNGTKPNPTVKNQVENNPSISIRENSLFDTSSVDKIFTEMPWYYY